MLNQQVVVRMLFVFFFNDTATTEIYTLSLHDALPILAERALSRSQPRGGYPQGVSLRQRACPARRTRSEEHTSELQSLRHLVCRLLLGKKKTTCRPGDLVACDDERDSYCTVVNGATRE